MRRTRVNSKIKIDLHPGAQFFAASALDQVKGEPTTHPLSAQRPQRIKTKLSLHSEEAEGALGAALQERDTGGRVNRVEGDNDAPLRKQGGFNGRVILQGDHEAVALFAELTRGAHPDDERILGPEESHKGELQLEGLPIAA